MGDPLFDVFRLVAGSGTLLLAAVADLRTRRVTNRAWYYLVAVGGFLAAGEALWTDAPLAFLLAPVATVGTFLLLFTEGEILAQKGHAGPNKAAAIGLGAAIFGILLWEFTVDGMGPRFASVLGAVLLQGLFYLFYLRGILRGGADAKAYMALAVLVPTPVGAIPGTPFPLLAGGPAVLALLWPFAFAVLANAALISVVIPISLAALNASRGHTGVQMLFGYRLSLDLIAERHVWLMERAEKGGTVVFLQPRDLGRRGTRRAIDRLRAAGADSAWVSPQVPFLVPTAAAFLVTGLMGNLLLALVGLAVPG